MSNTKHKSLENSIKLAKIYRKALMRSSVRIFLLRCCRFWEIGKNNFLFSKICILYKWIMQLSWHMPENIALWFSLFFSKTWRLMKLKPLQVNTNIFIHSEWGFMSWPKNFKTLFIGAPARWYSWFFLLLFLSPPLYFRYVARRYTWCRTVGAWPEWDALAATAKAARLQNTHGGESKS